ncbi:DUF6029 family protein [Adhaeribacter soli]|uniref:Uncharacterized protein n=1 Tax=Adhaeribacter soli TaxID=2607655 RepID=A0A5N1J000_9BACT|nr:DUF6029 family protein [Adhaeribacter soli]KAA9333573.1 hypothetical protein F0P94_09965 [Adhaeribacter soli]
MKRISIIGLLLGFWVAPKLSQAQFLNDASVHGDFQLDAQYYKEDKTIGAPEVKERVLSNGFANFIFTAGDFSAGIRYESYLNPLQGFDPRYKGSGIPYRFASYQKDNFQITVGNYYEQFGSGLIFRTYEERGLGFDNSMDGIRVKYKPANGVRLTGILGRQRAFFDLGEGIVRGADAEISLNEVHEKFADLKTNITFGGSFISKFQEDQNPDFNLPENVGAGAARLSLSRGGVTLFGEYAYKANDPSTMNQFNYRPGQALLVTASYSEQGLGVSLGAKRVDNMDFRSDRNANGNVLMLNFLPPLTKQHTYNLPASIYPYATQPLGEMSYQGEVSYNFKRESVLGGKYGTNIAFNYSAVHAPQRDSVSNGESNRRYFTSDFFKFGKQKYFHDFNVEIQKKFSSKLKGTFTYLNFYYDIDVVQGLVGRGTVNANMGVVDLTYKFNSNHSVRTELQALQTEDDQGDWGMALVEYTVAPHWFVAVMDQYNYGNPEKDKKVHYPTGTVGYNRNTSRISLSYGRQRAGIVCVGGVCRNVPASNGLLLSITSSF